MNNNLKENNNLIFQKTQFKLEIETDLAIKKNISFSIFFFLSSSYSHW